MTPAEAAPCLRRFCWFLEELKLRGLGVQEWRHTARRACVRPSDGHPHSRARGRAAGVVRGVPGCGPWGTAMASPGTDMMPPLPTPGEGRTHVQTLSCFSEVRLPAR